MPWSIAEFPKPKDLTGMQSYITGFVFVMVSNSQLNFMQDMYEPTKPNEQCHAMVHKLNMTSKISLVQESGQVWKGRVIV